MSTENTRAEWDNALQLPANKMPLQNLNIDSENLKYYLTHEEYNILLKAVQSLINNYTEIVEGGGGGGSRGSSSSRGSSRARGTSGYFSLEKNIFEK